MIQRTWSQPWVVVWAFTAAVSVGACRSSPRTDAGEGLHCAEDADCPSSGSGLLRCAAGACIFNSRPVITGGLDICTIDLGESLLDCTTPPAPVVEDVDGDDVVVRWVQLNMVPVPLISSEIEAPALDLMPARSGVYVLQATPHDGREDGDPVEITVTVLNAPPTVTLSQSFVEVDLDNAASATAMGVDPEGEPITFEWTQVSGPPVTPMTSPPGTMDNLTFTPSDVALYTFAVRSFDGDVYSEPVLFEVFAKPAGVSTVFVTDVMRGTPTGDCGAFLTPCSSLGDAMVSAGALTPPVKIFVAAPSQSDAYDECLDVDSAVAVEGSFDPASWVSQPNVLRARTRVVCDQPGGHRFSGSIELSEMTFASSVGDSQTPLSARTVLLDQGAPMLTNIDVESPGCGPNCASLGIETSQSNAVLTDVNVRAAAQGFVALDRYIGILIQGGAPDVVSTAPIPRALGDGGRGQVTLDTPVNQFSIGLWAIEADTEVAGLVVAGGLGDQLIAMRAEGGTLSVASSLFDLTGFGSRALGGLEARDDALGGGPTVTATNNTIFLRSSVSALGAPPCLGAGIIINSAASGHTVTGNAVETVGDFGTGLGLMVQSPETLAGTPDVITDNVVTLDRGRNAFLCDDLGATAALQTLIGMVLAGDQSTVQNNIVDVGGYPDETAALQVVRGQSMSITDNVFQVGLERGPRARQAFGAILQTDLDPAVSPNEFARNRAVVDEHVVTGVGLLVLDDVRWTVANNYLHGGRGAHGIGAALLGASDSTAWPNLVHNTIYGGADPVDGLTSRAMWVALLEDKQSAAIDVDYGFFENNLLDAGDAPGRRYLVDNARRGMFTSSGDTNYGQIDGSASYVGDARGLELAVIADPFVVSGGGSFTAFPGGGRAYRGVGVFPSGTVWPVMAGGAGQLLMIVDDEEGMLVESGSRDVGGLANSVWSGVIGGIRRIVVSTDDAVYLASNSSGYPDAFIELSTDGHVPSQAVAAQAVGGLALDLVTLEEDATEGNQVWAFQGNPGGAFAGPRPIDDIAGIEPPLTQPTRIAPNPLGNSLTVVDSDPSTGLRDLVLYPSGARVLLGGLLNPGETVSLLQWIDLGDELDNFAVEEDLVLMGGSRLYVLANPGLVGGQMPDGGTALQFCGDMSCSMEVAPCNGGSVVAVQPVTDTADPLAAGLVLVCGDGSAELFNLVRMPNLRLHLDLDAEALPAEVASVAFEPTTGMLMFLHRTAPHLSLHTLSYSGGWSTSPGLSFDPLEQIGSADSGGVYVPGPPPTILSDYNPVAPTAAPCPLITRESVTPTLELDLVGNPGTCVDRVPQVRDDAINDPLGRQGEVSVDVGAYETP